jgi:hypothetical protein
MTFTGEVVGPVINTGVPTAKDQYRSKPNLIKGEILMKNREPRLKGKCQKIFPS